MILFKKWVALTNWVLEAFSNYSKLIKGEYTMCSNIKYGDFFLANQKIVSNLHLTWT